MNTISRVEKTVGLVSVALVLIGCLFVIRPFFPALLWAAIICYCTWPLYIRLEKKLKGRRTLSAVLMTLLITLIMVVPFVIVGTTLAENVTHITNVYQNFQNEGMPAPPEWVKKIPLLGDYVNRYWSDMAQNAEKTRLFIKNIVFKSKGWILHQSLGLGQGLLQLTLSMFIAFFFYRDGESVVARVADWGRRIAGDTSQRLLSAVGLTIKGVVYGILGTALGQGICAALGFWLAGVPSSFFLGLVTFFLSLIPGGPPFIWVPVTAWLFYEHNFGWGIFMGIWGFLVISGVDNVLRPYLISRGAPLPFALVLLGVMGGIIAFGFMGIFIGPTLLAVGYALIQEFSTAKA